MPSSLRRTPVRRTPVRRALVRVALPAVLGAAGLFLSSLATKGSGPFYAATFWTAAVYLTAWWRWGRGTAPGRPASGDARTLRDLGRGIGLGAALLAVFALGALLVRGIPALAEPVDSLLDNARLGSLGLTVLTTVVNGVGEELFFRRVVPRWLPLTGTGLAVASVGAYALVTAAMGVPLLVLAAVVIGAAAYREARATGSLVSPVALHLSWSLGMLAVLPPLMAS